jgi:hypothetical protein
MKFNELVKSNYEALLKRKRIPENPTEDDFVNDMLQELEEVIFEDDPDKRKLEVLDLMSVCATYLHHHNCDVEEFFEKHAVNKNWSRAKNK